MLKRAVVASLWFGASICACLESNRVAAVELPAPGKQDTIVVTADQAWESDDGDVVNFAGHFELTAPDYHLQADAAQIRGAVEKPSTIVATGSPVTFWVQDAESGERSYGQGERLEYLRQENLVRLSGNAVIQNDTIIMRSSLLEYNFDTKRLVSTGKDGVEIISQPSRH